jgi:hypothetical protein
MIPSRGSSGLLSYIPFFSCASGRNEGLTHGKEIEEVDEGEEEEEERLSNEDSEYEQRKTKRRQHS